MKRKFLSLIAVLLITISSSGLIFAGHNQRFYFNLPRFGGWSSASDSQSKSTINPAIVTELKIGGGYKGYFSVWRYSPYKGREIQTTEEVGAYSGSTIRLDFYDPQYERGEDGFVLYGRGKSTNYVNVSAYGIWNVK